jgi:hypothetical protein
VGRGEADLLRVLDPYISDDICFLITRGDSFDCDSYLVISDLFEDLFNLFIAVRPLTTSAFL